MHPWLTQSLDRYVIRSICARQSTAPRLAPRHEEARQVLSRRDFWGDEVAAPREVAWTSANEFQFASPVESPWKETQTVHGKLFRCSEDWTKKPTIVLVHGWNDDLGYLYRHRVQVRQCLKAGMNASMIELPYHLQRRPRGSGVVTDILSGDLYCSMLGVKQVVADIRAWIGWLKGQGCNRVGLWGISLGAWFTGIVSCRDDRVCLAVLLTPAVRMGQVLKEAPFCQSIRESIGASSFDVPGFDLTTLPPKVSRENLLLIKSEDDLFVSPTAIEDLWRAWGQPEIWRLRQAHVSVFLAFGMMRRAARWMAGRMAATPA